MDCRVYHSVGGRGVGRLFLPEITWSAMLAGFTIVSQSSRKDRAALSCNQGAKRRATSRGGLMHFRHLAVYSISESVLGAPENGTFFNHSA